MPHTHAPHIPPAPTRRDLMRSAGLATLAALSPLGAGLALAADPAYPTRPVKLVVPFPPGGSADVLGRVLSNALGQQLGQSFVVDNRAGGSGALGLNVVTKSEADGYTLGMTSLGPQTLLPALGRKLPYDARKDLSHIAFMGGMPLVIVGHNKVAANSLAELVALAKSRPGKLSIGSSGVPGQVAIEQFKRVAGIDLLHVPYKGDSPMAADLLGGQVDLAMLTVTAAVPHVAAKSFKMFASTGAKASPQLGGVRTIADLGYPGFEAELWYVLTAPTGTPEAIVQKLSDAVQTALKDAEVQRQFDQQALSPRVMDAPTVRRFIEAERVKWEETIRTANIQIDS